MKQYITPYLNSITVENADILTVSIGDGTFHMGFGSFSESVGKSGSGSTIHTDWNNDFE